MKRSVLIVLLCSVLILTILITSPFQIDNPNFLKAVQAQETGISDWGQFHGDESHAGFSSVDGPLTSNLFWSQNFQSNKIGLVATDGLLFVSTSNDITALSTINGTKIYSVQHVPGGNGGSVFTVYPALGGGNIYFGFGQFSSYVISSDYYLASDYIVNGESNWDTAISGSAGTSNYGNELVTYSTGDVFLSVYDTTSLSAYADSTGLHLWSANLAGLISTIPTIGGNSIMVCYSNVNEVTDISFSGQQLWNQTVDGSVTSSPAWSDGNFYLGTSNGTVFAISSGGSELWSNNIGGVIESSPAVAFGLVFVGDDNDNIYALNSSNGSIEWQFSASDSIIDSPAISANGIIYFGDSSGDLYALNATNGSLIWKWQTIDNAAITSSPVLYGGDLIVADQSGTVYAFGMSTSSSSGSSSSNSSSPTSPYISALLTGPSTQPPTIETITPTNNATIQSNHPTSSSTSSNSSPPGGSPINIGDVVVGVLVSMIIAALSFTANSILKQPARKKKRAQEKRKGELHKQIVGIFQNWKKDPKSTLSQLRAKKFEVINEENAGNISTEQHNTLLDTIDECIIAIKDDESTKK